MLRKLLVLSVLVCAAFSLTTAAWGWSTFWDGDGEPTGFTVSGSGGTTVNISTVNRGIALEDSVTPGGHNFYYRSNTSTSTTVGARFRVESYSIPSDGTGVLCLMTSQSGSSPSPRLSVGIKRVGETDMFVLLNVKDGSVLQQLQAVDSEWHEARLYTAKTGASYQLWWDSDPVRNGTAATSTTSSHRAFGASADYGCTGTSSVVYDYFGYNSGVFTPEKDPPTLVSVSSPQYATGPITVNFSSTDPSRVYKGYLWYKKGAGNWTYHGEGMADYDGDGRIPFDFPLGQGTYYFRVQLQDKNGNFAEEPTGDTYDDSTLYQLGMTYSLNNGYISFRGSYGEMKDVKFDPTGSGSYPRITASQIFHGDICPAGGGIGWDITSDSLTLEPVPVYSLSSETGVTSGDRPDQLTYNKTLGQSFTTTQSGLAAVSVQTPTWTSAGAGMTLSIYKDGPGGSFIAQKRFDNLADNSWYTLPFAPQDAGTYYIEMSAPTGTVGWWTSTTATAGQMYVNRVPSGAGSRTFKAKIYSSVQARISITLDGPNLNTQVTPYSGSSKNWHMVVPFESQGYEISNVSKVPFSRFFSDKGHYVPISQLKRRTGADSHLDSGQWAYATGNGTFDLRISPMNASMYWTIDSGTMDMKLGTQLNLTVEPHTDAVPDFFPAFYTSDPAFDRTLNSFLYDRALSWGIGGVAADWFEWTALINFWMARPGLMEHWRSYLQTYTVDAEGYVYTWGGNKGWPFPDNNIYDTRHFTTNPNFILACHRFYAWTKDRAFLTANAARIRRAMSFMLTQLDGDAGILVLPAKDHGGTPNDVPSNYWDDIPFGGQSAYENAYFYASLGAMSEIETALGDYAAAVQYRTLAETCRQRYNQLFWNNQAGRYIGCIDENGVKRDYGFTYVNMEAATYGLPDKAQVERIYNWMENGTTSSGQADTYTRYRFAPRVNTIDCRNWWYLNGTAEIPAQYFDTHLENGGAILYTSGYDIMARAKYLGADNACARLQAILDRYMEPDRLSGGSPLCHGEINGWQVGTDIPFPEAGIVPASFLYAFIGAQATASGLTITPNIPSRFSHVGVRNLRYQGMMLDIMATRTSVRITCTDPGKEFGVEEPIEPGGSYAFGDKIPGIKKWPNGVSVLLQDKVLYCVNGTVGYIEEPDRTSGIRIQGIIGTTPGRLVTVQGTLRTTSAGERYVEIVTLTPGAPASVAPVALTNSNLGGGPFGMQSGVSDWRTRPVPDSNPPSVDRLFGPAEGPNNTGMLVTAFGRITAIESDHFYVDDGSGIDDGDPGVQGIRVSGVCSGEIGDFATVTGASSCTLKGNAVVRLLLPTKPDDVVIMP